MAVGMAWEQLKEWLKCWKEHPQHILQIEMGWERHGTWQDDSVTTPGTATAVEGGDCAAVAPSTGTVKQPVAEPLTRSLDEGAGTGAARSTATVRAPVGAATAAD